MDRHIIRTRDLDWASLPSGRHPFNPDSEMKMARLGDQTGMKRVLTEGLAQPLPVVSNPVRIAGHDTTAAKAPPLLGEDTDSVLTSLLGLSADQITALRTKGAV